MNKMKLSLSNTCGWELEMNQAIPEIWVLYAEA